MWSPARNKTEVSAVRDLLVLLISITEDLTEVFDPSKEA